MQDVLNSKHLDHGLQVLFENCAVLLLILPKSQMATVSAKLAQPTIYLIVAFK